MERTIRIVLFSALVIVLLVLLVEFWLGLKVKAWIEDEVSTKTKGAVTMDIGAVSVSLIGRTVKFKRVDINGDSILLAKYNMPFQALRGRVEELAVKGIHWKKRDTGTVVRVKKLILKSSLIGLSGKTSGLKDGAEHRKKVGGLLAALEVGEIDFTLDSVWMRQKGKQERTQTTGRNIHVNVEQFAWNALPGNPARALSCEEVSFSAGRVQQLMANGNLLLSVDGLNIGSREGNLQIDSVGLLPQLSKEDYAKVTGQDWTRVKVSNITGEQWDFKRLLSDRLLKVGHVGLEDVQVSSFKNRKLDQPEQVKQLFYEGVQQFPLGLEMGKIDFMNVNVVYEELSENGDAPGKITFDDLKGELDGLTNVVRADTSYYKLTVRGKLMDAGEFRTTLRIPVDSSNNHFEVDGELGRLNMTLMNPMVTPLTKVWVKSGTIDRATFHISGDAQDATVDIAFLYDDFYITLLKEKDGHIKERSLLTNILNGVFVRKNNPGDGRVRTGKASVERDVYRSQFNYLWRTLFAGIIKIVEE